MRLSTYMIPVGINKAGQIVGWEKGKKGAADRHGFVWQQERFTDLGTGAAYAINNRGDVAGQHERDVNDAYSALFQSYYWHGGKGVIIESHGSFDIVSGAVAINDQGFVLDGGTVCLWHNGPVNHGALPKNLLMLGSDGSLPTGNDWGNRDFQIYGLALNDDFEIAGLHRNDDVALWTDGSAKTLIQRPNASDPTVTGLNGADQVIGWLDHFDPRGISGHQQAFVTSPSGTQYLPLLSGDGYCVAYGINTAGEIVGKSGPHKGHSHAVIWKRGVAIDLNTLVPPHTGWILEAAHAVNDKGQIVGVGTYNGRHYQAFLLTPTR
jgi:probable HAF family extracellular repeat protein